MKHKSSATLSILLAGSMFLAVGCGSSNNATSTTSTSGAGSSSSSLNIALSADPPKLDPMLSSAWVDRQVFQSIYDKLVDIDAQGKIVPMLADKWDISSDGKTYTFHLHPGVKFTDGTDFNADAVKFNLERYMTTQGSARRNELKAVDSVTVVDPQTVKVTLKQPFAPFLSILSDRSGMMVSPTAVKKYGADYINHPVGTGPFMFQSRVKGSSLTLVKNPNYWQQGEPKVNTLTYKIFTDSNVALMNLKSGAVDMTDAEDFPTKEIANYKNDPNIAVINQAGLGYQGMYLNTTTAPFNNKYVREAVSEMIDRNAIVNVLLNGAGTPGNTPFSPGTLAYDQATDATHAPDVNKAKQLLAQGGQPNGFTFTLKIGTSPSNQQLGQMLQNMLKPAGITLNLQQEEFGVLLDDADKGNFQAMQLGWSGRIDPDQNIYDFLGTGGAQNDSKYSNPQVDALLKDARSQLDDSKRKADYTQIMSIANVDEPYVYFYHSNNVIGMSKKVQGFTYEPDGIIRTATLSK